MSHVLTRVAVSCTAILFCCALAHAGRTIEGEPAALVQALARATGSTLTYNGTREIGPISLSLHEDLPVETVEIGIVELLAIHGLGVAREGTSLIVTDIPDRSIDFVIRYKEVPIEQRMPQLFGELSAAPPEDGFEFSAAGMEIGGVIQMLQLICNRAIIHDRALPRHVYTQKEILAGRLDALRSMDRFLSDHSIVLVERGPSFLMLIYAHDVFPDKNPAVDPPEPDDVVRTRMEAVAEEIRRRRAMREKVQDQTSP